jgi:hypothetical protein
MPSVRDVALDGVLCTFSNISAPDRGVSGVVRQGRRHDRLSITYKILPCWAAVLGHRSSLWPPCLQQSSVQFQHRPAQRNWRVG